MESKINHDIDFRRIVSARYIIPRKQFGMLGSHELVAAYLLVSFSLRL